MLLNDARQLAYELMTKHELEDWSFTFDAAKRRFGQCSYRTKTISLSKHLVALNPEAEVRETILHEIAHALAGTGAGHGPRWREACLVVGAKPERCYDGAEVVAPQHNYEGHCPACGLLVAKRLRLKDAARRLACSACCKLEGGYRKHLRLVWTRVDRKPDNLVEFVDELPGL